MEDYIINVGKIEEWQMINDIISLDEIFQRAKRALVGGARVILVREQRSGESWEVGNYSNLDDLEAYRQTIYKYLKD